MANILEFIINIQGKQNGVVQQVQRIQNKVDDTDRSVQKLNGRLFGLKSALMSLPGAEFFTNPIVAISAATGVIAKMGMDADKTAVSFDVLLGSQTKSAEMLKEMNRYAADSPYSRLGVQEAAKTMLGFGVEADNVMSSLRVLGDIAMGDSERFKGLALVFSQVAAAGKLQGQDLLQLVTNGYNPLIDISKLTGKSVAVLREEMSQGKISFDLMRQAMVLATSEGGKYYKMNDKIAKTPFGRFGQLADQAKDTLISLYGVIKPLLIPSFNLLSNILTATEPVIEFMKTGVEWLVSNFERLQPILIGVGAAWATYNGYMFVNTTILKGWTIAQWAQVTAMIAAEKAQKLLNLAMSMNPVGLIVAGITALIAVLVVCWNKFDGFRATVKATWDVVKGFGNILKEYVVDRVKEIISGLGSMGKAISKLFKGDFNGAWKAAQKGAKDIVGFDSAKTLASKTSSLGNQIPQFYQQRLLAEKAKGISDAKAAGGTTSKTSSNVYTPPTDESGKGSESIVTGGTRNTQITMNINKFFDYLNVTMMDKADTKEIQRIVLESINRSLEIATSAAR
ncbi:MAG: tape measure protein [Bacteroides sp.]|jgi:tape measure domain-containing protein|uniref:tape measure protein n=1 Tax=Phocaeicola faecicola TaxID=2739389 RepID=UPI0015E6D19C|nr:tape measure protein [Phocaeicola faecicola]MCI5744028.1 tape measure protein [Bacteroides sp.]